MGLLAKRLALAPGDRLVQVAVHPYLDELTGAPATVYMHRVSLEEDDDPVAFASALTAFVDGVAATTSIVSPEWYASSCALLQIVEEDDADALIPALGGPDPRFHAPSESVRRACRLLTQTDRTPVHMTSWIFSDRFLRHKFGKARSIVEAWPASDLMLALLGELATGQSRKALAAVADDLGSFLGDPPDGRRAYLHSVLRGWSSTYDGPEVPA